MTDKVNPWQNFDYTPAPFWFLNHKLEADELRRQVRLMRDAGVSGFFLHPRAGLLTPYGSRSWYEMIRVVVEEAERVGLKAWLYDEDPYPSGAAGGKIMLDNPAFRARQIKFLTQEVEQGAPELFEMLLGEGRVLSALALRRNGQGQIVEQKNVIEDVGVLRKAYFKATSSDSYYRGWREQDRFEHVRSETSLPQHWLSTCLEGTGWTILVAMLVDTEGGKYGGRSDNLNRECVKRFIEVTHEQYRKYVGKWFGGVIPGIFTDEPPAGGRLPWTGELETKLREEHGLELGDIVPHLAMTLDAKSRRYRTIYWQSVHDLFECNFVRQIGQWCEENGLLLNGHFLCEEEPDTQLMAGVNVYSAEKLMGMPGFDHITTNIADRDHPSLNFGGKLISSVAHQQGIGPVSCEVFACAPWNFELQGMLRTTHWLYVLGITWLVPHGFFYSIDGDRKFDAGKSFFFHDPAYEQFTPFCAYAGRLGAKLGNARHESNLCVVMPVKAFYELLPADRAAANELTHQIYNIVNLLFENQIEFDIVDDATALGVDIQDGRLMCGEESYATVIVPATAEVSDAYVKQFDVLRDAGVQCLTGMPTIKQLQAAEPITTDIKVRPSDNHAVCSRDLMCLRKRTATSHLLFVFNNSRHAVVCECPVDERNPHAYVYEPFEDVYLKIQDDQGMLAVTLDGFGAVLIERSHEPIQGAGVYERKEPGDDTAMPYIDDAQWDYVPPVPLVAAIHQWDMHATSEAMAEPLSQSRGFCLARDILGSDGRYLIDKLPEMPFDKAGINNRLYPASMVFRTHFDAEDAADCVLVYEGDTFKGDCVLRINGQEVALAAGRRHHVYDPHNHVCDLSGLIKAGQNTIEVAWAQAKEFDGIRSSIYLMHKASLAQV